MGRVRLVSGVALGLYPISMYWLYTQWYKDYPQEDFHTFNDGGEWLQADKVGHAWTAYSIAKPLARSYSWAGISQRKAAWYGAGISYLYLSTVEVFDGFSAQWGFSWADMVANTFGTGLFLAQELGWGRQRIVLRYSFHQSEFSKYRPDLLGHNLPENFLKDYNGWTYWMCFNAKEWLPGLGEGFPKWLGLSAGYGVQGVLGGEDNPSEINGEPLPEIPRQRQYYLSLDIDLTKVRWKSKFLSSFFKVINIVKLPAPAVEFTTGGTPRFYLFYF